MKVQCPSCKEIVEMSHFSTSSEGLRFTCTACGKENFLPNPSWKAADPDIFSRATREYPSLAALQAVEEDKGIVCPKCGNYQTDTYACHRCGLVFEKFDPANLPPDPEEAAAIWQQIESQPFEKELHERFLQAVQKAGRLDYAARQYRLLERRPGLELLARDFQQRLLTIAQTMLPPQMALEGKGKSTYSKIFWLVVALLLVAGTLFLVFYYNFFSPKR